MKFFPDIKRQPSVWVVAVVVITTAFAGWASDRKVRVGLAWQRLASNYDRVARSVIEAGGEPVILGQLRPAGFDYDSIDIDTKYLDENGILLQPYADIVKLNTYHGTNADELLGGIDAVVFLGGCDISPTLFRNPEPWHGIVDERNYDTTRDLSEYLTMTYCLDHDIPILGLCRGMQMLGVVSGAPLIQHIDDCYSAQGKKYGYVHRADFDVNGKRRYTPHNVTVTDTCSLLYTIAGSDYIDNVPSWHHQAVGDVAGTPLRVTAVTIEDGVEVIEAIERTDKSFVLGVQFHPEEAVRKALDGDADACKFMPIETALAYFRALIAATCSMCEEK